MVMQNQNIERMVSQLNEPQREAVLHGDGPLVVFAGAGSGKTRVITSRIAVLMEKGYYARSILAMTFTNKAAKEMKERVKAWSLQGEFVPIGTFHSLCARWLREFAAELGFAPDFTIYDDSDSKSSIKKILEELKIKDEKNSVGDYLAAIGKAKTYGWMPNEAEAHSHFFPPLGVTVYKRYQEMLAQCHAMDFDDLLMNMLFLLKRNNKVSKQLQERYQHILIDEYQDTNPTQVELISYLVNEKRNIVVVGDDDQSIYSWRGADPKNILEFRSRYPGAKIIRLEQNYRCTKNIVGAASAMIVNNKNRAEKTLWTANKEGHLISIHQEYDASLEAYWVVDQIKVEEYSFPYENVAILYRINAQSRQLEDSLRKQNIPYRIYGALRFYDRAEIKDVLSYFRILLNPRDDIAFKRLVSVPPRGIGEKAIASIEAIAQNEGVPLLDALSILVRSPERTSPKLNHLLILLQDLKKICDGGSLTELLQSFLSSTDYLGYLQKKYPDSYTDRIANVHELGTALAEYEQANPGMRLSDWLNDVALGSNAEEEEERGVTLMTLHSAKGLEFPRVYIMGVEDGLIPHSHNLEKTENLEEERRLFYVGITRAKEKLSLVIAQRRRIFTYDMVNPPSRFLKEIPLEFFDLPSRRLLKAEPAPEMEKAMSLVVHPTYGRGKVKKVEYDFGVAKALVEFWDFGLRKVNFTHLKAITDHKNYKSRY